MGQRDPALEHGRTPPEQSFPVELLEAFLALTPDASVVVDEEGTIVSANERAEALFGYGPGELRGHKVDALVPERFRHEHRSHRAGYMAAPRAREMGAGLDLTGRRQDGSEFPVDISLAPLAGQERPLVVAAVRELVGTTRRPCHRRAARRDRALERGRHRVDLAGRPDHELEPWCGAVVRVVQPRHRRHTCERAGARRGIAGARGAVGGSPCRTGFLHRRTRAG